MHINRPTRAGVPARGSGQNGSQEAARRPEYTLWYEHVDGLNPTLSQILSKSHPPATFNRAMSPICSQSNRLPEAQAVARDP